TLRPPLDRAGGGAARDELRPRGRGLRPRRGPRRQGDRRASRVRPPGGERDGALAPRARGRGRAQHPAPGARGARRGLDPAPGRDRRGRETGPLVRGGGAVRSLLAARRYDAVVEDINKLPLYLPLLTRLPLYAIVPHLFGTTAFVEASWPVATLVWLGEIPIPRVYRRAAFHAISE